MKRNRFPRLSPGRPVRRGRVARRPRTVRTVILMAAVTCLAAGQGVLVAGSWDLPLVVRVQALLMMVLGALAILLVRRLGRRPP